MQDKRYDIHFHSAALAFTDSNTYKIEQLMQKRLSELYTLFRSIAFPATLLSWQYFL